MSNSAPKKADAATPSTKDGRRERTAQSRRRIVEAMIALAEEDEVAPSADLVAERAGVGRRTVFRLFEDMESLYREMHEAMHRRIDYIRAMPIEGDTWRARLDCLVERRIKLFEEILPLNIASEAHRHRSPFLKEAYAETTRTLRQMLQFVLPKNVKDDADLFEALDAALSIEVWRKLRRDQKLTLKSASRVFKRLVDATLA